MDSEKQKVFDVHGQLQSLMTMTRMTIPIKMKNESINGNEIRKKYIITASNVWQCNKKQSAFKTIVYLEEIAGSEYPTQPEVCPDGM